MELYCGRLEREDDGMVDWGTCTSTFEMFEPDGLEERIIETDNFEDRIIEPDGFEERIITDESFLWGGAFTGVPSNTVFIPVTRIILFTCQD